MQEKNDKISIHQESPNAYILTCGGKCCPSIHFDAEFITITDDFNNTVKLDLKYKNSLIQVLSSLF